MKKKLLLVAVLALLCTLFTCNALAWDCEVDGHVERTTLGKEKTCTVDGYTSRYCTECGEITVEVYEIREATGHVWRDTPFKTTAATCDAEGEERYMCKKCTEVNVVVLPKDPNNHSDIQKDLEQQPTCTEEGWYNLRCHGCAKLVETNVESVPAKGHPGFQAWKTTKLPTCTESGLRIRMCKACTYVEKEELGSLGGHKYGNWVTKMDASCLMEGKQERTCSVCGDVDSRDLAKLDHVWGEWKTDKAPGCETPGTRKHTCTLCNRAYETEDIDPIGHTAGSYKRVKEPTCEKTGLMQAKCVRCSYVMAEEDIPALGHDFTVPVEVKVTCTQDGYTGMACSREGCEAVDEATKKITRKAEGVHVGEQIVISEGATCKEESISAWHCFYCDHTWAEESIPSGKHTWGEWAMQNCESKGTRERKCELCGEVESEFIGYRSHKFITGGGYKVGDEWVRCCEICKCPEDIAKVYPGYDADYCSQYGHGYELVGEIDDTLPCGTKVIYTWKCAHCSNIKAEEVVGGVHEYNDWSRHYYNAVTKQFRFFCCEMEPYEGRYCTKCGVEETRYVGIKEHETSVKYSEAMPATCTQDAQNVVYACTDCNTAFYYAGSLVDVPEKKTGHSYVTIPAVPATATTPGLTAGVQCENCGQWKKAQFKVDINNQLVSEVAVLITLNEETNMLQDSFGNVLGDPTEYFNENLLFDPSLDNANNESMGFYPGEYAYMYDDFLYTASGDFSGDSGKFTYTYSGKEYQCNVDAEGNVITDDAGNVIGRIDQIGNISLKLDGVNYTYVGSSMYWHLAKDENFVASPLMPAFSMEDYLNDFYANIENGEELRARVNDKMCIAGTISAVSLHGNFDESQAVMIGLNEDGMVCPECSYPMTQWFNWIADQMKCFCTNTNCSHVEYTEP